MTSVAILASIPSPSFNSIDIGPISLNIYGLAIALGVVAGVWLFGRRLEERGAGTADDASAMAIWAVAAGVVGARLYHVATDWERFSGDLQNIPKIWEGGLGIPGGLALGTAVGLYMAHRHEIPLSVAATCAAPAVPLAQAIGRWGNYFNQELYGRATSLPWALQIDADHLVNNPETGEKFAVGTTFHPTFLYESLWNLGLVLLLLYIDRRWRPGGGSLFGLFVAGYGAGRFWVEGLRVDPADDVGPFRLNQWVALAAIVVGLAVFFALRNRPAPEPTRTDAADDADFSATVDVDRAAAPNGDDVSAEPEADDETTDLESADVESDAQNDADVPESVSDPAEHAELGDGEPEPARSGFVRRRKP